MSPGRGRRRQLVGVGLPELGAPPPDRLVTHRDTAYQHQLLDLTEAEREPEVQPHAVVDDLDRVAVALVRRRCGGHPTNPPRSPTLTNVTVPTASSAVVIGSGFIGCEAAASLALRGMPVTLVAPEPLPQETRLGTEAAERLRDLVTEAGARHVGGVAVEEITDAGVRLDNGVTIDCDLMLAATGVEPQSRIAAEAGLQIRDSRIVVGSDMATATPAVYAAGDVALAYHEVAGRPLAIEHWQDATDQGAIAGSCAAGQHTKWDGVPGFWTSIGDATVKYHAWGDGYERSRMLSHPDGFTVWYESGDAAVGVLTYNADDDYDLGERLIDERRPAPVPMR